MRIRTTSQGGGTSSTGGAGTIVVPATSQGTDTGVNLRRGDRVTITATGSVIADSRFGGVSAEGRNESYSVRQNYPVTTAGGGALIGYIQMSNGQRSRPFYVGSQQSFNAPVDGRLFLLINDDDYRDNSGQFNVSISVQ